MGSPSPYRNVPYLGSLSELTKELLHLTLPHQEFSIGKERGELYLGINILNTMNWYPAYTAMIPARKDVRTLEFARSLACS